MSWSENMVNVVRHVLFADDELKRLMAIPEADLDNMIAFRDKYFVRGALSDNIVTDEKVRILYYEGEPSETDAECFLKQRVYFDIYVRADCAYNATSDRMMHRAALIAKRLTKLLGGKTCCNLTFRGRGVYDQQSRADGYDRLTAVFLYKRIYK